MRTWAGKIFSIVSVFGAGLGAIGFASEEVATGGLGAEAPVIATKRVTAANLTTVYNRLALPNPSRAHPALEAATTDSSSAHQLALALALTVRPLENGFSELRWTDAQEREFAVLSNRDFSKFPCAVQIGVGETAITLAVTPIASHATSLASLESGLRLTYERARARLLAEPPFSFTTVVGDFAGKTQASELEALELLHAYYAVYEGEILASHEARVRNAEKLQQEEVAAARAPRTTTINYWLKPR